MIKRQPKINAKLPKGKMLEGKNLKEINNKINKDTCNKIVAPSQNRARKYSLFFISLKNLKNNPEIIKSYLGD